MSNQQPGALEPELDEVSDSGENGSRGVSAVEFGLLAQIQFSRRQPKSISVTYHRKEYFQEMNVAPSDSQECLTSFRQSHCSDTRCGQFLLGFFQKSCILVPKICRPRAPELLIIARGTPYVVHELLSFKTF